MFLGYGIVFLTIFLLNGNWLVGSLFLWHNDTLQQVQSFNASNIENFNTNAMFPLNVYGTSLLLYGFWGERWWHFLLPESINPSWFNAGFFLIIIIILWGYFLYLHDKKLFFTLLGITLISYILWVWTSSHIWGKQVMFLYTHVPLYMGMREPQKWFWLNLLTYSIFFASGVAGVSMYLRNTLNFSQLKQAFFLFLLIVFLQLWTPGILFWYHGQLFIWDFPKDFTLMHTFPFKKDSKVLIVPWHSYFWCSWTRWRIIANNFNVFVPVNTLISDNIEIGSLYSNSNNKASKDIEKYLGNHDIQLLEKNQISYVINLKHCADFNQYEYLSSDTHFTNMLASENLDIYKINYETQK